METIEIPDDVCLDFKIWFENAKEALSLLGEKKIELLEAVESEGSIKAAAEKCGIDYKLAWEMIDNASQKFDRPLVISTRGGGGGTKLTPLGTELIQTYRNTKQLVTKILSNIDDAIELSIEGDMDVEEEIRKKLIGKKRVVIIPLEDE